MKKRFQDLTNDELTQVLTDKKMFVFNFNQVEANIVEVIKDGIFEVGLGHTPEQLATIKAASRVSNTMTARFNLFLINTYESGGKILYRKHPNLVDCDVFVIFNEWEENLIRAQDYSRKIYLEINQALNKLLAGKDYLDEADYPLIGSYYQEAKMQYRLHVFQHTGNVILPLVFKDYQYPITQDNFEFNILNSYAEFVEALEKLINGRKKMYG